MQTRTGITLDTLLLFELNADQFKGFSLGREENEPVIWLSTEEGLLLYPDGLEGMDELIETCRPYLDAGTESDAIFQQSLVLCQAETGFGWQIYSATSTAAWAGQLGAIRNAYFGYLAVCLLLGGAASLVLTQKNFSPVRRLAERLQKGSGSTEQGFDALEKSLNQLLQRGTGLRAGTAAAQAVDAAGGGRRADERDGGRTAGVPRRLPGIRARLFRQPVRGHRHLDRRLQRPLFRRQGGG